MWLFTPSRALAFVLALFCGVGFADDHIPDLPLEDFFGVYVGRAQVFGPEGTVVEERDLDIVITPGKRRGFHIDWITVRLVDGRRDVPGVKRRRLQSVFEDEQDGRFVEDMRGSLFAKRKKRDLMAGDALRWARILGNTLSVYSFGILEDGRYEMQVYQRTRTDLGLDIRFRRVVDDELTRSISGSAVKVE